MSAVVFLGLAGSAWIAEGQLEGAKTGPQGKQPADAPIQATQKTKVDLNRAGMEDLRKLPGITSVLAERIVQHRPYRKLDDLVTRKVLGKKQFAKIRELVVVNPERP